MKHIKTIQKPCLRESLRDGGCGECQASCQSACKTSCTVANQACAQRADQTRHPAKSPGEAVSAISGK